MEISGALDESNGPLFGDFYSVSMEYSITLMAVAIIYLSVERDTHSQKPMEFLSVIHYFKMRNSLVAKFNVDFTRLQS